MSPVPALLRATPAPRRRVALLGLAAAALLAVGTSLAPGVAAGGDGGSPVRPESAVASTAWPTSVVDAAAYWPVQEGGRVKPMQSYAGFLLLRLNHLRELKTPDGRTISPLDWLLDAWFRPEAARGYACFLVDTSEVLDAVGLEFEQKKKRDRYSYDDLLPARGRLADLAARYERSEEKDRSQVENGVVVLDANVATFEAMLHLFDFARTDVEVGDSPAVRALFGGAARASAAQVFEKGEALRDLAGAADPHGGDSDDPTADATATPDQKAARALRRRMRSLAESADALAMIPPPGPKDVEPRWWSPGELVYAASYGIPMSPDLTTLLGALTAMGAAGGDAARIEGPARTFGDASSSLAKARGEDRKLSLEVLLYRLDPFYRSVWLYVFAFLALGVTWLKRNRWVLGGAWVLLLGAVALHTTGIVIRCVLRERPPISTLYETCLFISALGAILCVVAEAIGRRGIALAIAPVFGGLVLFIANTFEAMEGKDTMPQLQAVLDTNFWLATHVTCITIGYSGGLLAALVAHVTILGRAFGWRSGNDAVYGTLGRMTYGILSFGLVFSVVGTILGGIWANESWGRFWGWDPKENGALMICLVELAILHARMGGFIKAYGFAMSSVVAGVVVAGSWWGVNLLSMGLHSYGFTSGIWTGLKTFGYVEAAVLATGFTTILLGRTLGARAPATPAV